jgi:hypothetical protein
LVKKAIAKCRNTIADIHLETGQKQPQLSGTMAALGNLLPPFLSSAFVQDIRQAMPRRDIEIVFLI